MVSVVTVTGVVQVATPDVPSEQVKVTVTLALFQPPAFGSGDLPAEMVGAVLSTRTVAVWVLSTLPAASVERVGEGVHAVGRDRDRRARLRSAAVERVGGRCDPGQVVRRASG